MNTYFNLKCSVVMGTHKLLEVKWVIWIFNLISNAEFDRHPIKCWDVNTVKIKEKNVVNGNSDFSSPRQTHYRSNNKISRVCLGGKMTLFTG